MGNFFNDGALVTATVLDQPVACSYCQGAVVGTRWIQLNTSGAEVFGVAGANRESLALVCDRCGGLHEFLDGVVKTTPVG